MKTPSEELLSSFRAIASDPKWNAASDVPDPSFDIPDTEAERRACATDFAALFGGQTPEPMLAAILLPDLIKLRWSRGDIAGEAAISNPVASLGRPLDELSCRYTVDGFPLSDFRIFDAVTDSTGPIYVGFRVRSGVAEPALYLFDNSNVAPMSIDIPQYLRQLSRSLGILYWQYLFVDLGIPLPRKKIIQSGLDALKRWGVIDLDLLEARLSHRRSARD